MAGGCCGDAMDCWLDCVDSLFSLRFCLVFGGWWLGMIGGWLGSYETGFRCPVSSLSLPGRGRESESMLRGAKASHWSAGAGWLRQMPATGMPVPASAQAFGAFGPPRAQSDATRAAAGCPWAGIWVAGKSAARAVPRPAKPAPLASTFAGPVSGVRCPVSGVRCPVSGYGCEMAGHGLGKQSRSGEMAPGRVPSVLAAHNMTPEMADSQEKLFLFF